MEVRELKGKDKLYSCYTGLGFESPKRNLTLHLGLSSHLCPSEMGT